MGRKLPKKRACLRGRGKVYFVDGAHLLHNAVPSQGWIKRGHTVELRTNSDRNRLNVLGAFSPDDHSLSSLSRRLRRATSLTRFNVMEFGPLPRVKTWANCDYFVKVMHLGNQGVRRRFAFCKLPRKLLVSIAHHFRRMPVADR
jgi:hypothetical protein